jgi:DNA-binding PadR family transcriptional regulator
MTDAELAILGLIRERERHGYELEGVIEERGIREWTAVGFSSIYYLLIKLEKRGLVSSRLEEGGSGAARKVYSITPAGETACHRQTLERLTRARPSHSSFLLGVANAMDLPRDELVAALTAYRQDLAGRLENVNAVWKRQGKGSLPLLVEALFDYAFAMYQAEDAWVADLIKKLRRGARDGAGEL